MYGPVEEFYWIDSEAVLAYVSSDAKRFHVFVANRIQQIRDHKVKPESRQFGFKGHGRQPAANQRFVV